MRSSEFRDTFCRPGRTRKGQRKERMAENKIVSHESRGFASAEQWFKSTENAPDLPPYQEWLIERAGYAIQLFHVCIEINPRKCGGVPVLNGTRFTIAQMFAEIADGRSLPEICDNFELDTIMVTKLFEGLAISFDRPFDASYEHLSPRRMLG
jgi:uncharacterized protein (DUF433 family)